MKKLNSLVGTLTNLEVLDKNKISLHDFPFNPPLRTEKPCKVLMNSMKEKGFIVPMLTCVCTLFGAPGLVLIDGHRRKRAAFYAGLKRQDIILYVVDITINTIEELILTVTHFNNSAISWNVEGYVNCYAHYGLLDYKKIKQKRRDFKNISMTNIIDLALGTPGARNTKTVKNGTFTIKHHDYLNDVTPMASAFCTAIKRNATIRSYDRIKRAVIHALVKAYDDNIVTKENFIPKSECLRDYVFPEHEFIESGLMYEIIKRL